MFASPADDIRGYPLPTVYELLGLFEDCAPQCGLEIIGGVEELTLPQFTLLKGIKSLAPGTIFIFPEVKGLPVALAMMS